MTIVSLRNRSYIYADMATRFLYKGPLPLLHMLTSSVSIPINQALIYLHFDLYRSSPRTS
jgi:hypothetical protein